MPLTKKGYRQIANDILTQITGGETSEEYVFVEGTSSYRLSNTPVARVIEVAGVSRGIKKIFLLNADYRLRGDSIDWIAGREHPDEETSFTVKYVFTRASGISDLNPGSVVRTIVESMSREIEYLYTQTEHAYLSGFLKTAEGEALDLVVSILGITRKPPQPSSGYVTFGRNTEPEVLAVTGEVHLYDGSLEYLLKKALVKEIIKIEGTVSGTPTTFEKNVDFTLFGRNIRWLPGGKKPDGKTVFRVDYGAYREIVIPKGANVATFSARPEDIRVFTTTEEVSLAVNTEGKWETDVPVLCSAPGRWGNVLAGAVTVMPQAIAGVEYVINKGDITNGVEAEEDYELRERAMHALEFAGKATYSSLESAVRSVEGVGSLLIEDMPDGVPGLVKVVVDGGDLNNIVRAIDETRAAGVKVEISRPKIVYINVSVTLNLGKEVPPAWAAAEVEKRIRKYVSSLGIGEDVLYSRIIESVLNVRGVWDAKNLRISAQRADGTIIETEKENIEMSSEERAEPRNINISFEAKR